MPATLLIKLSFLSISVCCIALCIVFYEGIMDRVHFVLLLKDQKKNEISTVRKEQVLWVDIDPIVYVITPTYRRSTQKPDLTRLAQTLKHVKGIHWIVVEDSAVRSSFVVDLLNRSSIGYTHLNIRTPASERYYVRKKFLLQEYEFNHGQGSYIW